MNDNGKPRYSYRSPSTATWFGLAAIFAALLFVVLLWRLS